MSESVDKYKDKENYIVPMTIEQKAGHLHRVILGEMAPDHITGKRVLHVGCNAATTTYHLRELDPGYVAGIDVNEAAIEQAKINVPEFEFFTAAAHEMPFEDDSFDTIVLFAVFEHLYTEDKLPAVEEFKRVLKPSANILVQLPRAIPGSKDERLRQNAYDPHHCSMYFKEDDVRNDFPGWECSSIYHETRANENNKAHHNAWIAVFQSPKTESSAEAPEDSEEEASIRSRYGYKNSWDY